MNLSQVFGQRLELRIKEVFSIILFSSCCMAAVAMQPPHDFSDKSVAELLLLSESRDYVVRQCAVSFLGSRYRNTDARRFDIPKSKPESTVPQLPIPHELLPKLEKLLNRDENLGVRLCAVEALEHLRFRTNTSSILVGALTNAEILVRIRAASSLGRISFEYGEMLHPKVVPALIEYLNPSIDPDVLWQAAYAIGQLGPRAYEAIPALERLEQHHSKKVRIYAAESLARIRR